VTFGPHPTELHELAAVAGLRWTIEECFQPAKGETGLDHCEARSWAWLASAHYAVDARLGVSGGIARPLEGNADRRRLRQSKQKESDTGQAGLRCAR